MSALPSRPDPAITRLIGEADYFRRAPPGPAGRSFKEWQHFLVLAPGLDLLVNFSISSISSISGIPEDRGSSPGAHGRVILLAYDGQWSGSVEQCPAGSFTAPSGRLAARFAASRMDFIDGRYHLEFRGDGRHAISGQLVCTPQVLPALSHNIHLADHASLSWLMLPRLIVSGHVEIGGRRHALIDVPAYHDHNWGSFRWGDDFAWEWGCGLPDLPDRTDHAWSLIHVRMADRARLRVHSQGLFLWRGREHHRFFRDDELRVTLRGTADVHEVFKLPSVLAVLAPDRHCDVPAEIEVEASGDGDRVHMTFTPRAVAQVLIPDETRDDRLVVLNEACGDLRLEGTIRGEAVTMAGRGVFEFIR